jgi:hypothetical protein
VKIALIRTNLFVAASELAISRFKEKDLALKISAPERAAMEMLHLAPGKVGPIGGLYHFLKWRNVGMKQKILLSV